MKRKLTKSPRRRREQSREYLLVQAAGSVASLDAFANILTFEDSADIEETAWLLGLLAGIARAELKARGVLVPPVLLKFPCKLAVGEAPPPGAA
jgi:hypothetical protein